jgi:hypothetical protein
MADQQLWKVKLARVGSTKMNKNDRAALTSWEEVPHTVEEAVEACVAYETSATLEGPLVMGRLLKDRAIRHYNAKGRVLPTPEPGPGVAGLRYSGHVQAAIGEALLDHDPTSHPSSRRDSAPRVHGYSVIVTTPWHGDATFVPWSRADWSVGHERGLDEIARRAIEKTRSAGYASRGAGGRVLVSGTVPLILADWVEATMRSVKKKR